jgi:excisionase family DNA binding protein
MQDEYYTPEEIAARYKITRQAVYNWITSGRLRAIKLGRSLRIPREAFEEFVRLNKHQGEEGSKQE